MLPPQNRMRRRDEFTLAVRRGRRAGRPTLVVHLRAPEPSDRAGSPDSGAASTVSTGTGPDDGAGTGGSPLVGFIVARAVGNAVVRNRVRRRLRHRMRDHVHRLPPGSLLVVRATPASGTARETDLAADLESALVRLLRPTSRGRK